MAGESGRTTWSRIAWAGWGLRCPAGWRPIVIEGGWREGTAVLGDEERALLQLKWSRPGRRKWRGIQRRLASAGSPGPTGTCPSPPGFARTGCVSGGDGGRSRPGASDVWLGWSDEAGVFIEAVVSGAASEKLRKRIFARMLPGLSVAGTGGPVGWALFGAVFLSPAGFELVERRLVLGDLALVLEAGGGRRLLLRQVYPAGLALARRDMDRWPGSAPFAEPRRRRGTGEAEDWLVEASRLRLAGSRRLWRKTLPFPLRGVRPRWSAAGIVRDGARERLLIAEYDWPARGSDAEDGWEAVREAILGMLPPEEEGP